MAYITYTRASYKDLTVQWKFSGPKDMITLQIQSLDKLPTHWIFHIPPDTMNEQHEGRFKVPVEWSPGQKFLVMLCGMVTLKLPGGTMAYECTEHMEMPFRSEFTIPELHTLFDKALAFMKSRGPLLQSPCMLMTRDKSHRYYENVMMLQFGREQKYAKSQNGDPASVINGQIEGLFFGTNVDKSTGLPPPKSLYGPQRLLVPSHLIITPVSKLYFADFYCNYQSHKVTLVMCHPGTKVDKFCEERLPQLNKFNNPFLFMIPPFDVFVTQNVWVEVLCTESLHIPVLLTRGAHFVQVESNNDGEYRNPGVKKVPGCRVCNLYVT